MERKLQTIEKWSKAHRKRTIMQFDDLYTEDSVIELKGLGASSTLVDARSASEYNNAVGSDWIIKETWFEGERVHAFLTEQNKWLEAAGIREANYEGEFVIKEDKIMAIHLKPTRETVHTQAKTLTEFSDWVAREHPQQYSDIMDNGRLLYNRNAGKELVKMMHQWREEV